MLIPLRVVILGIALSLLLCVLASVGCYYYGERVGYGEGEAAKQREWNDVQHAEREENDRIRSDAFDLALQLQKQLIALGDSYAKLQADGERANQLPVNCPQSGKVGDLVLPAEFISSMFITDK